MFMYSVRARSQGNPAEVVAWANEIAAAVKRASNVDVEMGARVGGPPDMVWVSRHKDMADVEGFLAKVEQDAEYQAMVKTAVEKGYFLPGSVEAAIWRTNA